MGWSQTLIFLYPPDPLREYKAAMPSSTSTSILTPSLARIAALVYVMKQERKILACNPPVANLSEFEQGATSL
jgi:hypothetical protein